MATATDARCLPARSSRPPATSWPARARRSCSACRADSGNGLMTVKVVTVYESNLERGLPSHLATIGLYDAETGACRAFLDGTYITAVRTSAAAAVACDVLARRDARVLAVVGAGVQGEQHLRTFPLVRDFDEIRISSLVHEDAERLAAADPRARAVSAEEAVRGADVVALATHAAAPGGRAGAGSRRART